MGGTRSTTIRDRHRAIIGRNQPPCELCGNPIDYSLRWPHLWCFVVDHIVPLDSAKTSEERAALDVLSNKQAAHHKCNRQKWHRPPGTPTPATSSSALVTSRSW